MPLEQDRVLTLLGDNVSRRTANTRGLYWHTSRGGYNMAIFFNQTDPQDPQRPYEWNVGTYGCSFTADGAETSLDTAVLEAHKRLARYIQEVKSVELGLLNLLSEKPPVSSSPTRFERDPVV